MNICIYTSEQPSPANLLNIGHLIATRPEHQYSFLVVRRRQAERSWKEKLKARYWEWRLDDGRFEYHKDSQILKERTLQHVQPYKIESFTHAFADAVNDEKSIQFLALNKPDVIFQAGAGILKQEVFDLAKLTTINIHHGISPEVRGVDSTIWCLLYGIRELIGVTCHVIDKQLDTGCVIRQEALNSSASSFIDIQLENYLLGRNVLLESIDLLNTQGEVRKTIAGQVKSYYFSTVDPFLYYALRKRNFNSLMKIDQRTFKMKDKIVIN